MEALGLLRYSGVFTGAALSRDLVAHAEAALGRTLPAAYLCELEKFNGGLLTKTRYNTGFPTSWAEDHFELQAMLGLGEPQGIDSTSGNGTIDLIPEWNYPNIGIVLFVTATAGHDTVMLDYTHSSVKAEPRVVYVDEERNVFPLSDSLRGFLEGLVDANY